MSNEALAVRWIGTALDQVHPEWFVELGVRESAWLGILLKSFDARRALTLAFRERHEWPDYAGDALGKVPRWAYWTADQLRTLVSELGIIACRPLLVRTVSGSAVAGLRRALGDETYRQMVSEAGAAIADSPICDVDSAEFQNAVTNDTTAIFFDAVGTRLLTNTTENAFVRRCVNFAAPPQRAGRLVSVTHIDLKRVRELVETLTAQQDCEYGR